MREEVLGCRHSMVFRVGQLLNREIVRPKHPTIRYEPIYLIVFAFLESF